MAFPKALEYVPSKMFYFEAWCLGDCHFAESSHGGVTLPLYGVRCFSARELSRWKFLINIEFVRGMLAVSSVPGLLHCSELRRAAPPLSPIYFATESIWLAKSHFALICVRCLSLFCRFLVALGETESGCRSATDLQKYGYLTICDPNTEDNLVRVYTDSPETNLKVFLPCKKRAFSSP